uniref:chloride transport protein 6-like n=1 Tax=Styela clava TaxID=7725 RepID=UPI00193A3CAC|nr:chloride transport protein 6-like [Styela clava]
MSNCCRMRCLSRDSSSTILDDETDLIPQRNNSIQFIKDYESLDYDQCFNEPYRNQIKKEIQTHGKWTGSKKELLSWIVIFFIGVLTAVVAFFIDYFVKLLSEWKLDTVNSRLHTCEGTGCVAICLCLLLAFNISFVIIAASFVVFGEPLAAGSGIPEIKCYLNGVKVRNVVRFRTLVSKAIGVLFSVSGGLLVGKEGPMIHSGGVIGAGVPQFQSQTFKKLKVNIPYFRSDRDKRDFVSAGAAAGVAAAFGAPIGGVLFSLEEGSSFWNQSLTWKTLFCTMASTFTLNFLLSGVMDGAWGTFDQNGLLTFGKFECDSGDCHLWTIGDLLIFIAMGFVGGLLGALFNAINTKITIFRLKYLARKGKLMKIVEVIAIGTVTAMCAFFAPIVIGTCKQVASNSTMDPTLSETQQFLCPNGTYNDMATLMYNTQETAIKQLFHNSGAFTLQALAVFFVLFFFLSCWTYGASVPSGLFVPCILCGAAYGRFCAELFYNVFGMNNIYLGTFSLVGAAAFLGGVVRMTISLTVILIECTNEITYALPIMITLMVAKWAGDIFNHGIYDIHVFIKGVPLLEWDPPHGATVLQASDIMQTRLKYIYPHTRIRSLVNLLRTTAHNAFPVITIKTKSNGEEEHSKKTELKERKRHGSHDILSANIEYQLSSHQSRMSIDRKRAFTVGSANTELVQVTSPLSLHDGLLNRDTSESVLFDDVASDMSSINLQDNLNPLIFHGIILRSTLIALIKQGAGYDENNVISKQAAIDYKTLQEDYPRFPDIHDLNMDELDLQQVLDVTQYMNTSPYVVYPTTQLSQVFNLFRTMGLRHLPVINSGGEVVGVITRHDLSHDYIEELMESRKRSPSMMSSSVITSSSESGSNSQPTPINI